ncbi:MAG TPA: hypothetical protein VGM98_09305 [Schlesneria sp.]
MFGFPWGPGRGRPEMRPEGRPGRDGDSDSGPRRGGPERDRREFGPRAAAGQERDESDHDRPVYGPLAHHDDQRD